MSSCGASRRLARGRDTAGNSPWARNELPHPTVKLVEKHPRNPLNALPTGSIAARRGGNLSANVRLGGQHAFFYYSRPDQKKIMLTVALSHDALFQHITQVIELEPPSGDEQVIEKFESYQTGSGLHLIYEDKLASGHWGTGIRVYKILNRQGLPRRPRGRSRLIRRVWGKLKDLQGGVQLPFRIAS
jgi:hypothetical protein